MVGDSTQTDRLGYHRDTQQGLMLTHLGIHPNWDPLEFMKGLILWNNTCRMSKTQGNLVSQTSSHEDSAMMVYWTPEALNQTRDPLQQTFASKADRTKDIYCVTHPCSQSHQDE